MLSTLYIGGLAPDVRDEDLSDRFARFGQVVGVSNLACRGFAHVSLRATEQALAECVKVYTGATWRGRRLVVEAARPGYLERLQARSHCLWDSPRC